MAEGFVRLWGNDNNDGLNAATPKRSIQGAKDAGLSPISIKGWFNEWPAVSGVTILEGFDDASINGNFITTIGYLTTHAKNLIVENFSSSSLYFYRIENCIIRNCPSGVIGSNGGNRQTINSLIYNVFKFLCEVLYKGNTFHGHSDTILEIWNFSDLNSINCIFSNYTGAVKGIDFKVSSDQSTYLQYSLFINSKIKFRGGNQAADETTFEYPTGATDDDKLQNLKDRMATVYGGNASDYLIGCKYYSGSYNDIFLDADNGNFYLKEGCIASFMSYDGQPIGARPEGKAIQFDQDYSSINNIDANGKVTDQNFDASAE